MLANRSACGSSHSEAMIEIVKAAGYATVAAYSNFGAEPSTEPFLGWAVANGIKVLLPRVADDETLSWHQYQPTELTTGRLGMSEPTGANAPLATAECIFVPALAAGLDGSRLGRGKGYYDRALASAKAPIYVLVHNNEVFKTVPHAEHDAPVDAIITCEKSIKLK